MASNGESEPRESKTWVLKVSIHCEGCKKKVRKILQRINGVDTIEINSQKNQVIVTGNVEAETIIRKLLKSGKHSELWPTEKKPENPKPKTSNNNENTVAKEKNKAKEEVASKCSEPDKPLDTKPKTDTQAETETDKKPETSKPDKQSSEKEEPETEPVENDEKVPETSKEEGEKKPENDTKPTDGEKKRKKEKKLVETEDRSIDVAAPMHQHPIYHQSMYVSSYNMVQPTQSYAHVVPVPQNYASSYNPPQDSPNLSYPNYPSYASFNYPPQAHYPNYPNYPPDYPSYSNESYHGSMGYEASSSSSQPQGSYDYFNDENANSCSVM